MSSYSDLRNGIRWTHTLADIIDGSSAISVVAHNANTYRITGTVYTENRLVEFELWNAALIVDEEFVAPEVGAL